MRSKSPVAINPVKRVIKPQLNALTLIRWCIKEGRSITPFSLSSLLTSEIEGYHTSTLEVLPARPDHTLHLSASDHNHNHCPSRSELTLVPQCHQRLLSAFDQSLIPFPHIPMNDSMDGPKPLTFDIIYALCGWLDKPTLIALNMVNRFWYNMTVDLVWAQVTLPHKGESSADSEGLITTLLCSPRSTPTLIKCLQINLWESFVPFESEASTSRRVSNIIDLLKRTTGLQRLFVYLNRADRFGQLFYQELAMNAFSFKLFECAGLYGPELVQFLKTMTSLKSLTMFGIQDHGYGWSTYRPDPDHWPSLQSISANEIESVARFIPGRPIQRITVLSLSSQSPRLGDLIDEPVESVKTFKMQAWESEYSPEGAHLFADYLSDL